MGRMGWLFSSLNAGKGFWFREEARIITLQRLAGYGPAPADSELLHGKQAAIIAGFSRIRDNGWQGLAPHGRDAKTVVGLPR